MSEKSKNPVKAISLVMLLTLVGKLMGLLRDRLLTVNYGSGMETNAFLTASRIPRVFFDAMFASAIAASFIPVFNELLTKKGKKQALDFSSNFISVIGLIALVLTVLGTLFAAPLVSLFADGYDNETAALCASLTRVMFPTVFFTAIAYSFVGILQSFDEFSLPALISVVANGIIIIYYYTLNGSFGIFGLACAFLVGWLMQAFIQLPAVWKKGLRYRPNLSFRSEGMKKVFALMLPVMVSTWVQPINLTINSKFGSRLFDGAGVSAIELSSNLYLIIIGVFVLSVTNVIFPRLSRMRSGEGDDSFGETVRSTLHATVYVVLPMTAGLMILANPAISLIYGGGEFDAFSVGITSRALVWFSLGMPGYAVQTVLSRVYFAQQDGKTPLVAGAVSIAVNIILCAVLIKPFDVAGLAVASTVSVTAGAAVLAIPLGKRGVRPFDRQFVISSAKALAASCVMAAGVYGVYSIIVPKLSGKVGELISLAVPAAAGVAIYFILTSLLRCDEAVIVLRMLRRGRQSEAK